MFSTHNLLALLAGGCLGCCILLAFDARREPVPMPAPASNLCIVQASSAVAPPAIVVIDCGKERVPSTTYARDDNEEDFEQRPLEEVRRMPHP